VPSKWRSTKEISLIIKWKKLRLTGQAKSPSHLAVS
jgi:hypothetical protein